MQSTVQNKKVSIIVPVYNVAEYLKECLQSILNQTYSNIEIILINDGSKDNSLEICKKIANEDSRIKLFDNENHGVSYTRNFGLQNCTGDYIAFVDSDDIVAENYIETLVSVLELNNADMSICGYTCFSDNSPVYTVGHTNNVIKENFENAFFTVTKGMPWCKLFKREILFQNGINFNKDIFVCEDLLFNIRYAAFCKNFVFNSSKLYGYRQRESSAAHNTVSPKWFTVLKTYKYLFNNYSEKAVYKYVVFNYLKFLYEAKYIIKTKKIKPDFEIDVLGEIKRAQKQKSLLTLKEKLKLFICKHFFFVVEKRR